MLRTISSWTLFSVFAMSFFSHFPLLSLPFLRFLTVHGPLPRHCLKIPFRFFHPLAHSVSISSFAIQPRPLSHLFGVSDPFDYFRLSITCPNMTPIACSSPALTCLSALHSTNVVFHVVHIVHDRLSPSQDALRPSISFRPPIDVVPICLQFICPSLLSISEIRR